MSSKKQRKKARRFHQISTAETRGIDRQIRKENGSLIVSRGIHTIQTSRKDKRRSRRSDRLKAIRETEE